MSYRPNSFTQPSGDFKLENLPSGTVSSLKFSNDGFSLAATAWDGTIRFWKLNFNSSDSESKLGYKIESAVLQSYIKHHESLPILCCDWNNENESSVLFSGGCDKKIRSWVLETNQFSEVGSHTEPVKNVIWLKDKNLLVSSSWEKNIKFWDLRQPQPAFSIEMSDKILSMDCNSPLLVVATADHQIHTCDINNPSSLKSGPSKLSPLQVRDIKCFPDLNGFVYSNIGGRCVIEEFLDSFKSFSFKSNVTNEVGYPVNSIAFATPLNSFATGGSDGYCSIWEKNLRTRLYKTPKPLDPITSLAFGFKGQLLAYATGDDYRFGKSGNHEMQNNIFIHSCLPYEIKR